MKPIQEIIKNKPIIGWALFFATIIMVFLLGLLASSIMERRAEAVFAYTPQVNFGPHEPRNEVWGENFPRQYESYMRTADTTFRSKHGGAATVDMLEVAPELVVLWAGYPFSKDYNQGRGHYYAVKDVNETLRTGAPMNGAKSPLPNTCWTCKSPDVPRLMAQMGPAEFYKGTWETKGSEVVNHIGCADCHDPKTMNLQITRPALVEAYQNMGKDITKATHQEMRSLVCAQCHVEYYFDKKKVEGVSYLVFPWHGGTTVEAAEEYYDKIDFSDWTHSLEQRPYAKGPAPRLRNVHHRHTCPTRRCVCRLPHALQERGWTKVHRPPHTKPAQQRGQLMPSMPPSGNRETGIERFGTTGQNNRKPQHT
jgi:nitrite reductase (cytochrome c-552)